LHELLKMGSYKKIIIDLCRLTEYHGIDVSMRYIDMVRDIYGLCKVADKRANTVMLTLNRKGIVKRVRRSYYISKLWKPKGSKKNA